MALVALLAVLLPVLVALGVLEEWLLLLLVVQSQAPVFLT